MTPKRYGRFARCSTFRHDARHPGVLVSPAEHDRRSRHGDRRSQRSLMTTTADAKDPLTSGADPLIAGRRTALQHALIYVFVGLPMVALVAAVPLGWGWGVGWHDLLVLV